MCDDQVAIGDEPMLPYSGPALPTNTPEQAPATNQAPHILIIEDEPLIALMIEEMVEELGYGVSGLANTMAMASQEFAKHNYDAVLMDINMGGRYHAETADHLLGSGIPFAFVTGYDYLVEPRHVNVPVLQKPFEPADLRSLLEELVGPVSSKFGQVG
jgi:CheY-like chemotaxis protein